LGAGPRARGQAVLCILERCEELRNPRYLPSLWASDTWTNCGLFILKQLVDKSFLRCRRVTRVTRRHQASPGVTRRHQASPGVTKVTRDTRPLARDTTQPLPRSED